MRHWRRSLSRIIVLPAMALVLVAGSSPAAAAGKAQLASAPAAAAKQKSVSLEITFYGFLDNSPPGTDIQFPRIHSGADGTGTASDPITFATDPNEFKPGTRIYVPFLQKYFIMEDGCVQCEQDFSNGKKHVDLWTGGSASSGNALIQCEDSLTQDRATIIVNPPGNRPVDTTPLFDDNTGQCFQP